MSRRPRPARLRWARLLAALPVLAGLAVTGAVTRAGPPLLSCAQAATAHHAALVVEHGDGAVVTVCVAFTETSITGEQLLSDAHAQAGLEYATSSYGGTGDAVCQVDYEPAQYPPGCWTASSPYWAMFVSRRDGAWAASGQGISSQTFQDGDAEGFRYEGQSDFSPPPSPAGVCPPPATAAPTPTATPVTTPSAPAHRVTQASAPAAVATAPATATPPATGATPTTASGTPSPAATSASPGAAAAVRTASRPAPPAAPAGMSGGAWAASGLGFLLLLGLGVQVARSRRATGSRVRG